jgi:hypothetical protein
MFQGIRYLALRSATLAGLSIVALTYVRVPG